MKVMKVLAAVALLATLVGCGRSEEEQRYYDFGYETASELIDEGADSEEEVLSGCDVTAAARGYNYSSVALKPFNSGCRDRWEEE